MHQYVSTKSSLQYNYDLKLSMFPFNIEINLLHKKLLFNFDKSFVISANC